MRVWSRLRPGCIRARFLYSVPVGDKLNKSKLQRALLAWHDGVKFGSSNCAAAMSIEFRSSEADRLVSHIDMARSERYGLLARILEFYPDHRFPNLDKILPLPPADLPFWNGDRDTLLNAARGVSYPPPTLPLPNASSKHNGRFFLDPAYRLMATDDITEDATAPFTGYWQPILNEDQSQQDSAPMTPKPALYQVGERFEHVDIPRRGKTANGAPGLQWRNWRTVLCDDGKISPPAVCKRTRIVAPPAKATACPAQERCPVAGIWQPWVRDNHPMESVINKDWRQAWLLAGQHFPDPKRDWMLDVAAEDITWHLMDSVGIDTGFV